MSHFIIHIPFFIDIKCFLLISYWFISYLTQPLTIMSPTSDVFKPFSGQELSTGEEKATGYSPWLFIFDGTKETKANCAFVELKMMRLYVDLSMSYDLQALSAQRDTVLKQRVLLIAHFLSLTFKYESHSFLYWIIHVKLAWSYTIPKSWVKSWHQVFGDWAFKERAKGWHDVCSKGLP